MKKAEIADKEVDYFYWAKKSSWTSEQAAMLKVGLDPNKKGKATLPAWKDETQKKTYFRTLDLIKDAEQAGKIKDHSPQDYMNWFGQKFDLPPNLLKAYRAVLKWEGKEEQIAVNARAQQSTYLLLGAIIRAIYKRDFIPYAKNSLATEIKSDLDLVGVNMDDDTILDNLVKGYTALSNYHNKHPKKKSKAKA